jgi:hypothetical protein
MSAKCQTETFEGATKETAGYGIPGRPFICCLAVQALKGLRRQSKPIIDAGQHLVDLRRFE